MPKPVTFTMCITLGNDAMQTYADIAGAVQQIFSDFARRNEPAEDDAGRIYDANGNRVSSWTIDE